MLEAPSLVGDTPDRTELARKVESFINSCDSLKVEVEVQHAKDPIVRGVSWMSDRTLHTEIYVDNKFLGTATYSDGRIRERVPELSLPNGWTYRNVEITYDAGTTFPAVEKCSLVSNDITCIIGSNFISWTHPDSHKLQLWTNAIADGDLSWEWVDGTRAAVVRQRIILYVDDHGDEHAASQTYYFSAADGRLLRWNTVQHQGQVDVPRDRTYRITANPSDWPAVSGTATPTEPADDDAHASPSTAQPAPEHNTANSQRSRQ